MHRTEPKVFLVAETQTHDKGLQAYFDCIGARNFKFDEGLSGSEKLTETMSRMCYRSFEPGLNANIGRVREGNAKHIANIIKVGHGSVTEHATVSFIFHNVSRVFTHELVRHRAGCAMSQESLRYVRLTDLGLWLPECINAKPEMVALFEKTFENLEALQLEMARVYDLDNPDLSFGIKKKVTSAMRRIAPIGLATSIGFTMNHRALRHILTMRTSPGAEEEIRIAFAEVGRICMERWPNLYQDMVLSTESGLDVFSTNSNKI